MKHQCVRRFLGTVLACALTMSGAAAHISAESAAPAGEEINAITGVSAEDPAAQTGSGTDDGSMDGISALSGAPETGSEDTGAVVPYDMGAEYTDPESGNPVYAGSGSAGVEDPEPENGADEAAHSGSAAEEGVLSDPLVTEPAEEVIFSPGPAEASPDHACPEGSGPAEEGGPELSGKAEKTEESREAEDSADPDNEEDPFRDTLILEETYGMDFSSCRLVMAADESQIADPVHILSSYNGIFLMQYAAEEEARLAYSYYKNRVLFVEPDIEVFVADDGYLVTDQEGTESLLSDGMEREMLPAAPDGMTEDENPLTELAREMPAVPSAQAGTVAVIDTGMDMNANVTDRISVIGDDPGDDNGHGNRMAELILQQAPDASLISVKAIGADGKGNISSVYAAMRYAIAAGPEIILLPVSAFATAENAALRGVVEEAAGYGIRVIGAAGNNGQDAAYFTPGGIDAAIIAGAAGADGVRLSSSNFGASVDYYVTAESTSQAAAILAGFIAANGEVTGINENGLIFSPDYVPDQEQTGEGVGQEPERGPDEDTFFLTAEDGSFVTSDRIQVTRFEYPYGDMQLGVHYVTSTGQLLYCIEPEKSSSGGTYDSITALNSREKTMISYIIANGLQRMNSRSANPAYAAARSDTRKHGAWTLYNRDYEITQMAIWHVVGREFGLANQAENAQREALYRAAEDYARTNQDGSYYIRELKMPAAGTDLPLHLNSSGTYYESADFTVSNRSGQEIEVNIGGGPGGVSVIQTDGIVNGNTLTRTYRVRVPVSTAGGWVPGKKNWTIRVRGSGEAYSVGIYRNGGGQAVTLLAVRNEMNQQLSATASLVIEPSSSKLRLEKKSSAPGITDGNDGYSLAGAVYGIYTSEEDADSAAAAGKLSGKEAGSFTTKEDGSAGPAELKKGTYYIREITAGRGFLPDGENHRVNIAAGEDKKILLTEEPVRAVPGLRIRKINGKTGDAGLPSGSSLEGAEYTIRFWAKSDADPGRDDPSRTWVIKTVLDADGNYEAVLDDSHLVSGPGAPYGKTDEGAFRLPLGTIVLQETKGPKGFETDENIYTGHIRSTAAGDSSVLWDTAEDSLLSVRKQSGEELLHREMPYEPEIATTAVDKANGSHLGTVSEEAVVTDTVRYSGLISGEKYRLEASLVRKTDRKVLCRVTRDDLVCADGGAGEWKVEFPPIDSTALQGDAAVAFEKLYIGKEQVASHEDPEDEDQTVYYPEKPHKQVDKMSNSYEKADHVWTVTQKIPEGYASLKIKDLVIEDTLDERLSWDSLVSLVILDAGEKQLEESDYTVEPPEAASGGTLIIRIDTPAGIKKLAENEGRILELKFRTRISSAAKPSEKVVYEEKSLEENGNDALIPNQALVRIGPDSNWTEIPFVYTARIGVHKVNGSGQPAAGAVFLLLGAGKKPFIRNGEGYAQTTGEDGMAEFAGLENGTYYLREIKAPEGTELLKEDIRVLIEQGVVSSVNGMRLSGDDRTITVRNNGQIVLMTGGSGAWPLVIPGLLMILGGCAAGWRRKRKKIRDASL